MGLPWDTLRVAQYDRGAYTGILSVPEGLALATNRSDGETWLVLNPGLPLTYRPVPAVTLRRLLEDVGALIKSAQGDDDLYWFARRYGWLKKPEWVPWAEALGQPLEDWRREFRYLAGVLWLRDRVNQASMINAGPLATAVRWWDGGVSFEAPVPDVGRVLLLQLRDPWDEPILRLWKRGDLLRPAHYALLRSINGKLQGAVDVRLQTRANPEAKRNPEAPAERVQLMHAPNSLLAAVYLQLAISVAGGREAQLGVCQWCGDPMVGRRGRRWCSDRCRYAANETPARRPRNRGQAVMTEGSSDGKAGKR